MAGMASNVLTGLLVLIRFEEYNGAPLDDGSGDMEIPITFDDVLTSELFTPATDDEDHSANRTSPYSDPLTIIRDHVDASTNQTTRYNSLSTVVTNTQRADYSSESKDNHSYDWQSTQPSVTESIMTVPSPMDIKLALCLGIGVATAITVLIAFVFLCFLYKYQMDLHTLLRIMRSLLNCKYRSAGADSSAKDSHKQMYMNAVYDEGTSDHTADDDNDEDCILSTESVIDISKLVNSTEEQEDMFIGEDDLPTPSNPIPVEEYITYFGVNDLDQQKLRNEYDTIRKWSKHLPYSKNHAKLDKNRGKNRYFDIIPFDYNRVPLYGKARIKGLELYESMPPAEKKEIRYINASFIHGYGDERPHYVAAQGPLSGTLIDFWDMVWQEESDMIVMLTSLKEHGKIKCERYWPEENGGVIQCGEISIKMDFIQKCAYHDYRRLEITKAENKRKVHHYLYHQWPDKEAPDTVLPILNLYRKAFLQRKHNSSPVIVHCSAGVGRTGTFISLHYLQEQAKQTNTVDIMACVAELRRQRVNMVQRVSQYVFLYEAIHEALQVGSTAIRSRDFSTWYKDVQKDPDNIILKQFKFLDAKRPIQPPENEIIGLDAENREKNRDLNIVPDHRKIAFLSTFMSGRNAYINAVYVDTFRETDAVIVTQLPLVDTICDFWRLVYDSSSTTIVLLENMDNLSQDAPKYWPEDGEEIVYGGVMAVRGQTNKELSTEKITVRDLNVITKPDGSYSLDVKMLQLNTWATERCSLPDKLDLIELIQMTQKFKKNATAVQCFDGCEKSGLFCACMYIIDQIHIEKEVDVYQASRITMTSRPQFIQTEEQYKYLYEFALEYLKNADTRAYFIPVDIPITVKRRSRRYTREAASKKHQTISTAFEDMEHISNLVTVKALYRSENELADVSNKSPAPPSIGVNSAHKKNVLFKGLLRAKFKS